MRKKQSNYIICFILTFLLLSMNIQVFANSFVRVNKVSLNKPTVILTVGRAYTLKATISPANAKNKAVKWTSSNTKIAKVDTAGKVTALKIGTATITVATVDKGLKATCKVTIKSSNEDISSKFKDKNFKNYVYTLIGKSSSEPILYDDVKNIKHLEIMSDPGGSDYFGNFEDLSGIEYFTALTTLSCYNNKLATLDVSKNKALTTLNCANNKLTTLDVSNNKALTTLICDYNKLTTLDVSKNIALSVLGCNDTQLTTLDVSKNTVLTALGCSNNKLTTLDISKNILLTHLNCDNTQLTTLDVNKHKALTYLECSNNKLTILDVSKNTALTSLICDGNKLTTLDVSKNKALNNLYCVNNQLTTLYSIKDTWNDLCFKPQYIDSTRETTTDSLVITIKQ